MERLLSIICFSLPLAAGYLYLRLRGKIHKTPGGFSWHWAAWAEPENIFISKINVF
jgi:hypothetical protein